MNDADRRQCRRRRNHGLHRIYDLYSINFLAGFTNSFFFHSKTSLSFPTTRKRRTKNRGFRVLSIKFHINFHAICFQLLKNICKKVYIFSYFSLFCNGLCWDIACQFYIWPPIMWSIWNHWHEYLLYKYFS